MEEMKLFDIETRKYLELGKEWLYGGNGILLIDIMQKEINESLEIAIVNAMQGNEHTLYQYSYGQMKTHPTGTLKTLCDLTGAVVYGGRYVLNPHYATMRAVIVDGGEYGKIYRIESLYKCKIQNYVISGDEYLKYRPELVYTESGYTEFYIYGNPFEEYSKSLRNEENKLEEILNLIK